MSSIKFLNDKDDAMFHLRCNLPTDSDKDGLVLVQPLQTEHLVLVPDILTKVAQEVL